MVVKPNLIDIAKYYFVDDLSSALTPSTRLRGILEKLHGGRLIPEQSFGYLQSQELNALCLLAKCSVTYEEFSNLAKLEQIDRQRVVNERREADQAAQAVEDEKNQASFLAQQAAISALIESERLLYEAMLEHRTLLSKYGLCLSVESEPSSRLISILRNLDLGKRFYADELLWFETEGREYYSEKLWHIYNQREATHFADEYHKTKDLWHVASASKHYRKSGMPSEADKLLSSIFVQQFKLNNPKLQSVLLTTHGGVKRDLGLLSEALQLGLQAHKVTPDNFRPCTLLGAVSYELGKPSEGDDWYKKAVDRGYKEHDVDRDLKNLLRRVSEGVFQKNRDFLLKKDPVRYDWVNKLRPNKSAK